MTLRFKTLALFLACSLSQASLAENSHGKLINRSSETWTIYKCDTGRGNLYVGQCKLDSPGDTCELQPEQSYELSFTTTRGDSFGSFAFIDSRGIRSTTGTKNSTCYFFSNYSSCRFPFGFKQDGSGGAVYLKYLNIKITKDFATPDEY
jgi:hypothetical protein